MSITETKLGGAYVIDPERLEDERGFFANAWTREELRACRMPERFAEGHISYSRRKATLRGMHFQTAPHAQAKLVRCTRGAIYDVGLDLRRDSPTFKEWVAVELTAENRRLFFLPAGFAHGFQTLEDDTEVFYMVSEAYAPASAGGVRWDDPAFQIEWPETQERILLARDREYPDFAL